MAAKSSVGVAPCGACKFLRRKCVSGCIFAPHFTTEQGAARFAAVHKVFGASNVSKLLVHIPVNRRHDAVVTISYEAQARLADPVYGCVSTILSLQHQVASLQLEVASVQNQLINTRLAFANALQSSQRQHQHHHHNHQHLQAHSNIIGGAVQPAYSNNSLTEFVVDATPNSSQSFDPFPISRPPPHNDDDDDRRIIPNQTILRHA